MAVCTHERMEVKSVLRPMYRTPSVRNDERKRSRLKKMQARIRVRRRAEV